MADNIWISRVSNLARLIVRHYGAACVGSIAAIGLCVALWSATAAAGTRPLFCVLVPHFKDEYWLSVGYGLEQEAQRQNVDLVFFQAGGYRAQARQIEQLSSCTERGSDAILIGAVASDYPPLSDAIADVAQQVPVFGLVNELHADALSGRIGVAWSDMGHTIGAYLADRHPAGSPPKTAILISGPAEAGWTGPLESGLRRGLDGSAVTILEVFGADTGLRQQLALVETALERHPNADYLIGSAPAVEAAIGLLAVKDDQTPPRLLSTYISHTILRGLMNGSVEAASFDDPVLQGVMAIRQAVSPTAPTPEAIGPQITLLTRDEDSLDQVRTSPARYFPAVQ